MIRSILLAPDPVLRAPCAAMDSDATALARDLLDTMYDAVGRGLAGPQIGVSRRIFVMDCGWKDGLPDPRVFVNPEIVARTGRQVNVESCLSIPDVAAPDRASGRGDARVRRGRRATFGGFRRLPSGMRVS